MRVALFISALLLLAMTCAACNSDTGGPGQPENPLNIENAAAPARTDAPPAQPDNPPGLKGLLPPPSGLRQVSWNPLDHLAYGSLYFEAWPHANVEKPNPPLAEFSSDYQHQASPEFADLSYALYALEVSPDAGPVLATSWITPPEASGCYIGLANYANNAWDWYACTGEEISVAPLAAYLEEGIAKLAVVVLEQGPLELQWLRIGANLPPDVRLDADTEYLRCEETVSFDLGGSTDPELDIALYELDFDGDGTFETSSPDVPTGDYSYLAPGTYTVVGRVTDGEGLSATAELTVYVSAFTPQLVDATGYSPSIAIDPVTDTPKISYSGGEHNGDLRVATMTDPVDIQTLYSMADVDMETALLLTPQNMEIAFGSDQLFYAIRGEYNDGTLVDPDKAGGKPAIVTNGEGETSIFYSQLEGEFPLQTAHFTRAYGGYTGFSFEQLDAEDPTGKYCDAVYEGYLTCAYAPDEGQSSGRLMFGFYSTIDGWTWITARENMHRYSSRVSLAIDPIDHMPRLAYIGDPDGGGAYHDATYAWYAEDEWLVESLEEFAWDCDLALNADNQPHVVVTTHIVQPERSRFWYHWFDGSEWHREFIGETPAGEADYIELALDAEDTAHVCWSFIPADSETSELWYAGTVY